MHFYEDWTAEQAEYEIFIVVKVEVLISLRITAVYQKTEKIGK